MTTDPYATSTVDPGDVAIDRHETLLCIPCAGPFRPTDIGIAQFDIDSWPDIALCEVCDTAIPVGDVARAVHARTHYWRERAANAGPELAVVQAEQDAIAWTSHSQMHAARITGADIVTAHRTATCATYRADGGAALFADLKLDFDEDDDLVIIDHDPRLGASW